MISKPWWSVLLLLFIVLVLLGGPAYAQTSTPFIMTGTITMTYDDGSTSAVDVAIAGIETMDAGQGSMRGTISVGGQAVAIEDGTARRTVHEARYYSTSVEIDGRRVAVSILLGHPQDPTFGNISITDGRTNGNIGYGRGPIT